MVLALAKLTFVLRLNESHQGMLTVFQESGLADDDGLAVETPLLVEDDLLQSLINARVERTVAHVVIACDLDSLAGLIESLEKVGLILFGFPKPQIFPCLVYREAFFLDALLDFHFGIDHLAALCVRS